MIIVDFSGIAVAAANHASQESSELDENFIRHRILNSLRMYNKKYRDRYGRMVIACDSRSWRSEVYPQYKASRKKKRSKSTFDWKLFYKIVDVVRDEIKEFLPYPVIKVERAEADDIIGTLALKSQEFGQHEEILIISSDKDFIQLQQFSNVKQFSPYLGKFIEDIDPHKYLFEHICRGDSGDGVPNILSADNVFVDGIRQTPIRKKKLEEWWDNRKNLEDFLDDETWKNFNRNDTMVNLRKIPEEIPQKIFKQIGEQYSKDNKKIFNYLITKKCPLLAEATQEFFTL